MLLQRDRVSLAAHEQLACQQHHAGLLHESLSRLQLQQQCISEPMPQLPQGCSHRDGGLGKGEIHHMQL